MTHATRRLGQIGEQIAARHLESLGCQIVERNWRVSLDDLRGEVDLVVRDGHTLVFCEVKTRRVSVDGDDALCAVTAPKQRQLRRLAGVYLTQLTRPVRTRFDVIAVTWPPGGGDANVVHVVGAF